MTRLMAALQDKTLSDGSPPLSFEKALYLALLQMMDYLEQQRSRLVRVCGLQKVDAET